LEIRDSIKIKTFNWFCDDHWKFDSFSKYYAPFFSYVVTTDKESVEKYKKIGIKNVIVSQWACNHFLFKNLNLPYKYDVSFVGQPHGNRAAVIKKIRKAGIEVSTFGYGWPRGRVSVYEMVKIFNQSKINLNFSNASEGLRIQIHARDFEIPGCMGFMITGGNEYLKEYFSFGKEVVVYSDTNDLINKIEYYLTHDEEREKIRRDGYLRVLKEHTYTRRFAEIFKIITGK